MDSMDEEKVHCLDVEKDERDGQKTADIFCGPVSLFVEVPRALITGTYRSASLVLARIFSRNKNDRPGKTEAHVERLSIPDLTANIITAHSRPFAISPCCDLFKRESRNYGPVVIRRIRFQDDEVLGEEQLKMLALPLLRVHDTHVLPYFGTCDFEGSLCVVFPFAEGGDLKTYLRTHPDCDRRNLISQVAQGLKYLHNSGVTHGNLHTRNVLLSGDQTVQLSDFGLSEVIPDEGTTSMRSAFCREKAMHRAPEAHMGEPLSATGDIYSLGMLGFYMFADKEPMIGLYPGAVQVAAALLSGRRPTRGEITRSDFSDNLWTIVQHCWAHDKKKRPSVEDVLADLGDTKRMPARKARLAQWRKFA